MKKLVLTICLLAGMVLVQGCMITQEQANSADYGPYPANYKELIQEYFAQTLIDPESVRYSWQDAPYRAMVGISSDGFGWYVHVGVNAKNRLGGYIGEQNYVALLRYEQIINVEYVMKQMVPVLVKPRILYPE